MAAQLDSHPTAPPRPGSGWARPAGSPAPPNPVVPPLHTSDPPPPGLGDDGRAGAMWVAATGAFLLFVAAAVFVATRWDQITDALKLAALGLMSGGFLTAGRALKQVLPGAASAMYHLGAFLIPVTVAAVGVSQGASWPAMLLAQGIVGGVGFWLLDRTDPSVLLRWAAGISVVLLSAGIGGVSDTLMAPWLSISAVIASLNRSSRAAVGWAIAAAMGPAALAVGAELASTGSVLSMTHGLWTGSVWLGLIATWAAGTVLVVEADRNRQVAIAAIALASTLVGSAMAWTSAPSTGSTTLWALAALFLAGELGATLTRRDTFWAPLTARLAATAEVISIPLLALAAGIALRPVIGNAADFGTLGPALVLSLGAWMLADQRRRIDDSISLPMGLLVGSGWRFGTVPLVVTVLALAAIGFGPGGTAAVALGISALLVVAGRPMSRLLVVMLCSLAPLYLADLLTPWEVNPTPVLFIAGAAAGGALLIAVIAVVYHRSQGPAPEASVLLAMASALPVALGATQVVGFAHPLAVAACALVVMWAIGAVLDRIPMDPNGTIGIVPRLLGCGTLLAIGALDPDEGMILAVLALLLTIGESVRLRDPLTAQVGVITVPVFVLTTGWALGASLADTGLVLLSAGAGLLLVSAGLRGEAQLVDQAVPALHRAALRGRAQLDSRAVPEQWVRAALSVSSTCVVVGGYLALLQPRSAAHGSLVLAGLLGGLAAIERRSDLTYLAAAVATVGVWYELSLSAITAPEPYLFPVSGGLVLAGWFGQRRDLSSWVAYGPAIALLGGVALLERVTGEPGWHALLAGSVGLAAVIIGGWQRLAAPLFLGTALIVTLAGYESLAVTTTLPTWLWLGLGGMLLLGAGIAMERAATGPIESGRRLVEVISDRFA